MLMSITCNILLIQSPLSDESFPQLRHEKIFTSIFLAACRMCFIFQQQIRGFRDEFRNTNMSVKAVKYGEVEKLLSASFIQIRIKFGKQQTTSIRYTQKIKTAALFCFSAFRCISSLISPPSDACMAAICSVWYFTTKYILR